jgi:hypothetical protein
MDAQDLAARDGPGSRVAAAMGLVGIMVGIVLILDPRGLLDAIFLGRAAPAAVAAFTYTDAFRARQAPVLLLLVMLNLPMLIAVLLNGRRTALMRRLDIGLGLATCAVLAWTILDGPALVAPSGDRTLKWFLALVVVFTLIDIGIKLYRERLRP